MSATLGLIGVGNLGEQFMLRCHKLGRRVVAYDKFAKKKIPEKIRAESIFELTRSTKIVVSFVPNDTALRSVVSELLPLQEEIFHISCSTVSPHLSRELAYAHKKSGHKFVAAPVFARPENLRDGQACFILSGATEDVQIARKYLHDLAEKVVDFGSDPGAANVVKLAGNFMIASSIELIAEALALVEKNGVDRQLTMGLMSSTIFNCPIFKGYGHRVATRDHRPGGFALEHGLKDINLILDTANQSAQPLPLASLLQHRLRASDNFGHSHLDWSAFALRSTADGGLHHQVDLALQHAVRDDAKPKEDDRTTDPK
uniref:6-phosphogluconate dehydrogenase NADP-binding domain-containing protein n=1 Tax=Aureoumbra lagunensis TaxID=44058 RepID=A0A7S3JRT6_9STRA